MLEYIYMYFLIGNGEIVYTDIEGQLGKISNSIETDSEIVLEPEDGVFSENVDLEGVKFDDDDEDDENAISVEKLKRECLGSPELELKDFEGDK